MHMDPTDIARAFVDEAHARSARLQAESRPFRGKPQHDDAQLVQCAARILAAGGGDVAALDRLAAKRNAALKRRVEQDRHASLEQSPAVARMLAANVPAPAALDPESYLVIDEVTFLRTFNDGDTLINSQIAQLDNWARYRYQTDQEALIGDSRGRLGFFTLWKNDRNRPVVISAGVHLHVHAYLSAHSSGSGIGTVFGINSTARGTVRARTTVHVLGEAGLKAVVAERTLAEISATGGFFDDDSCTTIVFSEYLSAFPFTVPRQETILIEVELLTEDSGGGTIKLDAEGGAYRVAIPHILLVLG